MAEPARTVMVTGASRGLGRAIACRFAADGDRVIVVYRQRDAEAQQSATLIREAGGVAELLRVDLRDAAATERELEQLRKRVGSIQVLVNNAAAAADGFFAMQSATAFDELLAADLGGTLRCTRAIVRDMLAARGGAIVNVSSVMTRRGQPGQVAYVTSKGAIEAFTRALALELGPRGIRVNAVVPGVFATGMSLAAPAAVQARWLEAIPMRRLGEPDELAKAVHWLASTDASYITGATLVVDGGLSL
jgi:3-oxoacyl-[acyl-carrier protein] reductase